MKLLTSKPEIKTIHPCALKKSLKNYVTPTFSVCGEKPRKVVLTIDSTLQNLTAPIYT